MLAFGNGIDREICSHMCLRLDITSNFGHSRQINRLSTCQPGNQIQSGHCIIEADTNN